jgi:hypothetical protein
MSRQRWIVEKSISKQGGCNLACHLSRLINRNASPLSSRSKLRETHTHWTKATKQEAPFSRSLSHTHTSYHVARFISQRNGAAQRASAAPSPLRQLPYLGFCSQCTVRRDYSSFRCCDCWCGEDTMGVHQVTRCTLRDGGWRHHPIWRLWWLLVRRCLWRPRGFLLRAISQVVFLISFSFILVRRRTMVVY